MLSATAGTGRLLWLDAARTLALLAMIVFHFVRDLEMFSILPLGYTFTSGWPVFARAIAASFLFLSGLSFVIAHGQGLRINAWLKRLAMIFAAAAVISIATYIVFPAHFIYFGILHIIAVASVIGAVLLYLPAWALALFGSSMLVAYNLADISAFTTPWLGWTGLSSVVRPSLDFLPLFPWLAPFALGMAVAKAVPVQSYDFGLRRSRLAHILTWPGRHSLAVYLIHQPVMLFAMWLVLKVIQAAYQV